MSGDTDECVSGAAFKIGEGRGDLEQGQLPQKKKNRRKERHRNTKSRCQPKHDTSDQFKSLNLNGSPTLNGFTETENVLTSSILTFNTSESKEMNSGKSPPPAKRKNRKKKNVALASIEKLKKTPLDNEAVSFLETSSCGNPGKVECKIDSKSTPVHENSGTIRQTAKNSTEKKFKQGISVPKLQQSVSQPRNPKLKQGGGSGARSCKTDESFLNENKFDDFIVREQAELMLKEQQSFVVKGFLRINQRNYREAYISNPDGTRDIMIEGVKNRNRALEGDEVIVFILPPTVWKTIEGVTQKVARVVHILTKVHHRQAVGNLKRMQDGNSRLALFSPRDSRFPRMHIPMNECPKNPRIWEKCLFHARIIEWDDVRFAKGQLIGDSFGVQGDVEVETHAILLENEIEVLPYDQRLYKFFPKHPFKPSEEDIHGREDLRKICIFTIDPLTAKDLDDAVSCEKLDNGNFKVGVHISDVSFFLREGTPLDDEVARRATTTYLVQRAYHMLPREMTMMCSLLPGEDKLAFSVFWEITPQAEIISHHFTRSVIHSCTQLAYEHAQTIIDDPDYKWKDGELPKIFGGWTAENLKDVVLSLQSLATIMRQKRFESGALRVDQTKLIFDLNDMGEPVSFSAYVNKESHRLIEEFMLLANVTVATDLQKRFPSLAFLRCHDEPQPDMLQRLADVVEKFGIVLDISSAGSLHASLQKYQSGGNEARYVALNILCSKPMVRARYFCAGSIGNVECMRHYALNVPLYTHFTSPIRRYADVMVHRLLSAMMGYCEDPKWTEDYVNRIASNCNKMKFCAKKAGEQSAELFMALWVKQHGTIEAESVVVDVKDHSFDAVVCSTGSNIRVYTDKLAAAVNFDKSIPELKIKWAIAGGITQSAFQFLKTFCRHRHLVCNSLTHTEELSTDLEGECR